MTTPASLRTRLRSDLASRHDRLDRLYSELDVATRPGLTRFLRAHRAAFAALRPAAGGLTGAGLLARMIDAIDADLARLGAARPAPLAALRLREPVAQDYVLLGSRLGGQMLRRRWEAGGAAELRAAGRYLTLPAMPGDWRRFCERTGAMPGDDARAGRVLAEAAALFDLFARAGQSETAADPAARRRPAATERTA